MPDMPDNFKARISLGQMSDEAAAKFWGGGAQESDDGAGEASEDDR